MNLLSSKLTPILATVDMIDAILVVSATEKHAPISIPCGPKLMIVAASMPIFKMQIENNIVFSFF